MLANIVINAPENYKTIFVLATNIFKDLLKMLILVGS